MIFDAFPPRVRSAFHEAPVKLSASPRILLLGGDDIIAMIRKISSELVQASDLRALKHVHVRLQRRLDAEANTRCMIFRCTE